MPFDLAGNFTRLQNWQQDRDNGIRILADRHDAEDNNFATAFNQVFLRNGVVPMTGNLNMNGKKITTVAAGTEAAPGLTFELSSSTGLWQANPNHLGFSINGVKQLQVETNVITVPYWTIGKHPGGLGGILTGTGDFSVITASPTAWAGSFAQLGFGYDKNGAGVGNYFAINTSGSKGIAFAVNSVNIVEVANTGTTLTGANLSKGSSTFRVENSGAGGIPAGAAGVGIEFWSAGVQAYNRTTSAYAPLTLHGDTVNIGPGSSVVSVTAGLATVNGVIKTVDGTAAAPSYAFISAPTTGWWRDAVTGSMVASNAGVERLRVHPNNVIITPYPTVDGLVINGISTCGMSINGQDPYIHINNTGGSVYGGLMMGGTGVDAWIAPYQGMYHNIVAGGAYQFMINSVRKAYFNNAVGFYVECPSTMLLTATASPGNVYSFGDASQMQRSTSALKYKKDIKTVPKANARDILLSLRPIIYSSRCKGDDPTKRYFGLIAEEVEKVDNRLVLYGHSNDQFEDYDEPMPLTKDDDPDGTKPTFITKRRLKEGAEPELQSVQYERLVVPLIAYIQELEARLQKAGI